MFIEELVALKNSNDLYAVRWEETEKQVQLRGKCQDFRHPCTVTEDFFQDYRTRATFARCFISVMLNNFSNIIDYLCMIM